MPFTRRNLTLCLRLGAMALACFHGSAFAQWKPDRLVTIVVPFNSGGGADVIIAGEGVLNELVVHLGLTQIDGVGILDCIAINLLHTEMLVRAYRMAGLRTGRRWEYPKVPADLRQALKTPRA